MTEDCLLVKANAFAFKAHYGQKRKGSRGMPFICHPLEVANILAKNGYGDNETVLSAALLHDVVEDCGVKPAEIGALFGSSVVALVNEVTFINLTKEEKIARAPFLSSDAAAIKVADLISNLNGLVEDPSAMSAEGAKRYGIYADCMVDAMRLFNKPNCFKLYYAFQNSMSAFIRTYYPTN